MLGHDGTSQLIRLGLSDRPSDQVKAKVVCCKSLTTLTQGFHPSDLRVATHSQQVFLLSGCLTPLQRCSWCILQPYPSAYISTLALTHLAIFKYPNSVWTIKTSLFACIQLMFYAVNVYCWPAIKNLYDNCVSIFITPNNISDAS